MYEWPVFARQGWQCPVCGRVYSPDTMQCPYCANIEYKITTNTTGDCVTVKKYLEVHHGKNAADGIPD